MDLLEFIKEYWVILTALFALIGSYFRMETAIKSLKQKDDEQEEKIKQLEKSWQSNMAIIQTELKSISLEIKKIEISMEGLRTSNEFIKQELNRK
jgi:predicted  nucleic acid-binding Zn-ribbon protein